MRKSRSFAFLSAMAVLATSLSARSPRIPFPENASDAARDRPIADAESGGTGTSGLAAVSTTVLYGDPSKPGLYSIELKVAPNTVIEAHTHRDTRTADRRLRSVVLPATARRTRRKGMVKMLPPGSFYTEPGGQARISARTGAEGARVLITGFGPSDTVFAK